jgi:hypothetical protein
MATSGMPDWSRRGTIRHRGLASIQASLWLPALTEHVAPAAMAIVAIASPFLVHVATTSPWWFIPHL